MRDENQNPPSGGEAPAKRKRGRPRKGADDGASMAFDFAAPPQPAGGEPSSSEDGARRKRGRPPGPVGARARDRLASQGADVDDPERPTKGRRRKAPNESGPLRFGPGQPLNNPRLEDAARRIAGGMNELDALVLSGYSVRSLEYVKALNDPEFVARVGELRQADLAFAGPSLPFWLQRLMRIADADPALCFERDQWGRLKVRDILSMEPQARAAIQEFRYDKNGRPILKFHDRRAAIQDVIRTIAPSRVEVSGPGGSPLVELGVADPVAFEAELRQIIELKAEAEAEAAPAPRADSDAGEEAT